MNVKYQDSRLVQITTGPVVLEGNLEFPESPQGIVMFAHGSGSSRHSMRNQFVARTLREAGFGTLLFDLLTAEEEQIDRYTRQIRFDIDLLARRMVAATDWLVRQPEARRLPIGYFGGSTGAAAALLAAAARPDQVQTVVSRGGRPDLAQRELARVAAPTLLIVGGEDKPVLDLNQMALAQLRGVKKLAMIPGATHLFEEPGTLEEVARLAAQWFQRYLCQPQPAARWGMLN
ncbi:MAG: dienelactone hydrolase family protein [Caldilineaceae bacterium]